MLAATTIDASLATAGNDHNRLGNIITICKAARSSGDRNSNIWDTCTHIKVHIYTQIEYTMHGADSDLAIGHELVGAHVGGEVPDAQVAVLV